MNTISKSQLNKKQLGILLVLHKYRFATEQLLATSQGTRRRSMRERLRILVDRGYLSRRYDGTYSLAGKPAMYCLSTKAVAELKHYSNEFDYQALRNIRKDVDASDSFATHCINVFAVYCRLKELYGDAFKFTTSSEMRELEDLPGPLPDAYIRVGNDKESEPRNFLMDCYDDTLPQFVMRKRIARFVNHADDGEWTLTEKYPEVFLVCASAELQKKVTRMANKAYEDRWTNGLVIRVDTLETFASFDSPRVPMPD